MAKSGAILREVGATNRTHLHDYEQAIGPETAALLKVHTSNYRIIDFHKEVPLKKLVALGQKHNLPVAVRIDKMTLAALGATLRLYLDMDLARKKYLHCA